MPKKLLVTAAMFSLFCFQQGFAELKCYPPGPQDKGVYVYDETTNAPSRDPLPGECPANPPTGGVPINSGTTTPTQPPVTEPPATGGGTTTTPTTPTTPTNGSSEKFTEDEQKYLREKWEELKIESGTDISFDDYVKGIEFFSDPERFLKDGKEMKLIQDINGDGINDIDTNKDGIADTVFDPAKDSNVSELDNLPQADDMNGDGKADYDTDGDGKADLPNDQANQSDEKNNDNSDEGNLPPITYDKSNDKTDKDLSGYDSHLTGYDSEKDAKQDKAFEDREKRLRDSGADSMGVSYLSGASNEGLGGMLADPSKPEEQKVAKFLLEERALEGDAEAKGILEDHEKGIYNQNLLEADPQGVSFLRGSSNEGLKDMLADPSKPETYKVALYLLNERALEGDTEALNVLKAASLSGGK